MNNTRLEGYTVLEDANFIKRIQVRFPTSKKRRIQKKWGLRSANYSNYPDPELYVMKQRKMIVGHPVTIREMAALYDAGRCPYVAQGHKSGAKVLDER